VTGEVEGKLTIRFGDGQTRTLTAVAATKFLVDADPEPSLVPAAPVPDTIPPELAAQLLDATDELAPWRVYADWLLERDDPRGELMRAQIEREDDGGVDGYERESEVLAAHPELMPRLTDNAEVEWRAGFLSSVRIPWMFEHAGATMTGLLAHPSARYLRHLRFDSHAEDPSPMELVGSAGPAALSTLSIGRALGHHLPGGDLTAVLALPRLEKLTLWPHGFAISSPISAPRLAELQIETSSVDGASLAHLLAMDAPYLRSLRLTGTSSLGAPPAGAFARMPALRELRIGHTDDTAAWLDAVYAMPAAAKLVALGLPTGDLGGVAIRKLIANKRTLARLTELDLSFNRLPDDIVAELQVLASEIELSSPKLMALGYARPR
jgi:uncharacterized protein (TIGR02996 family)